MSAGSFQSSTFSQDHGLRLIRTRDQRVVINGIDDNGTYSMNRNTMRKHPDKVYYKSKAGSPLEPPPPYAKDLGHPFERDVVAVRRDQLRKGYMMPGHNVPRGMDRADTRVPVTATLNGVKAKSRAEIMERFKPIGLAELTGRDTDTPGMSIVCGGIMTAPNQRRTTLNTGMWLQAIPPDPDEAATPGGLVPTDGALANGRGRVPWVVDEYDPGHYNFYDGERVRTVLCRGVLRIRLNGEVDIDATGPPKDELLTDKRYREALQATLEVLRDFVLAELPAAPTAAEQLQATTAAALFMIAANQPRVGGVTYLTDFFAHDSKSGLRSDQRIFRTVAGLSDANVAVAITAFHDKIKAYAGNADKGKILQHRPIEKLIRALACTKLAAEDAIIGMCVMGARPGADYDVHLRAYGI